MIELMTVDGNLKDSKLKVFTIKINEIMNEPRSMVVITDLCNDHVAYELISSDALIKEKIEALCKPSIELCDCFGDPNFCENIKLSLLIKIATEFKSIDLNKLITCFSNKESKQSIKDTQRLVMRAIQYNFIEAKIDKQKQVVEFL